MPEPLARGDVDDALRQLPGWKYAGDKLQKTFTFSDFREAMSFMVRLAFYAEAMNHHPELHNVYNTVDVSLATHDAGDKVTEKDVSLAHAIEDFSWV